MKEIWKDIPEYEGKYQVSNIGNIRSLYFHRTAGKICELKQQTTHDGYKRVPLSLHGNKKCMAVHVLVANAFIPNPDNKPQVNHIDGNKENNTVQNLEWVTGKENIHHAISTGLRQARKNYKKGSDHHCSKPVCQYKFDGSFVKKWDCISDAARHFDCSPSTIINCCMGRIKSCKGFMWRQFEGDYPNSILPLETKNYPRLIIQKSLDGKIIKKWNGYKQLVSETKYRCGDICECCKGRQKSAYGFLWEEIRLPYESKSP